MSRIYKAARSVKHLFKTVSQIYKVARSVKHLFKSVSRIYNVASRQGKSIVQFHKLNLQSTQLVPFLPVRIALGAVQSIQI